MKRNIRKKLRSRTGASITFALLLFLVCAVLSVVILVAATTAAGRIAGIAESDQRYYSVTSASALLKQLIDGKTVTVAEVTKSTSGDITYTNGVRPPGEPDYTNDTDYPIVYVVDGPAYGMSAEELSSPLTGSPRVTQMGKTYKNGDGTTEYRPIAAAALTTITEDTAYQYYKYKKFSTILPNSAQPLSFALTASDAVKTRLGTGKNRDILDVTIKESIASDGTITLTVGKKEKDNSALAFRQELVFSATVSTNTSTTTYDEVQPTDPNATDNKTIVNRHKTEIETTTITWVLSSVRTVGGGS